MVKKGLNLEDAVIIGLYRVLMLKIIAMKIPLDDINFYIILF